MKPRVHMVAYNRRNHFVLSAWYLGVASESLIDPFRRPGTLLNECNGDLSATMVGIGRKAQFGFAVSLGQLHAYQTISEVQATSIAPKNR